MQTQIKRMNKPIKVIYARNAGYGNVAKSPRLVLSHLLALGAASASGFLVVPFPFAPYARLTILAHEILFLLLRRHHQQNTPKPS